MGDEDQGLNEWEEWKTWKTVKLETNKAYPEIGLLTLNRPDNLNAVDADTIEGMNSCLDFLKRAFDCRVIILCGAGRLFCSGVDLSSALSGEQSYDWTNFPDKVKVTWQMQHEISSIIVKMRHIPQPVIAAVHGAAVGVGMGMVNASDIVVATRKTKFINAFIKIGVSGADCGSSYFLPRLVGFHRSAELLYSGRDLMAEEAHQWGYVNMLVDQNDDVIPEAVKFAADLMLTRSPLGLRMTKEALNFNMDTANLESAIKFEDRNQTLSGQTDDSQEGIKAFFEKRRPQYGSR